MTEDSMTARQMLHLPFGFASGAKRALAGAVVWLAAVLIFRPSPFSIAWGHALLLLAPLALLPLGLDLTAQEGAGLWPRRIERATAAIQLPAAALLGGAYLLPQGLLAASLALPWLLTTALVALRGLLRVRQRGLKPSGELCLDAGLIYLSVGGAWTLADRLGFRPLDFDPVIVLLTAIHFHYAGFVLPIVTGLAARRMRGWTAKTACVGVIAGVPLVAIGITASQLRVGPLVEVLAAWWMAASGMLAAWLHLRLASRTRWPRAARSLWMLCGLSLFGSMLLAALYGARFFLPVERLDIPWMRALHGTANALGFGLASLLAWTLAGRQKNAERRSRITGEPRGPHSS